MTADPFAHDDAAYLLGALSPAQRRAFEEHLDDCEECARSVREVAGVPGLLSRLPEEAFTEREDEGRPPLPDTLLPRLLREVRRRRRRTRLVAALGVAAAVVLAALVAVPLLRGGDDSEAPAATQAQQMSQVDQQVLSATVALEQVDWGTKLRLTCSYDGSAAGGSGWGSAEEPSYALVVRTRDGQEQQVATWRAVADRAVTIDAATDADADDIAAVDVTVTGTDHKVLTLETAAS